MGEAILKKYAGDRFGVYSAGTEPSDKIFPPVVEVMREIGIDLSDKTPKSVEEFLGKVHFTNVIAVCSKAEERCPTIFSTAQMLSWPFDDPAAATGSPEEILDFCRTVRDQIDRRIRAWLTEQDIPVQT
jgi:arsenate reductase